MVGFFAVRCQSLLAESRSHRAIQVGRGPVQHQAAAVTGQFEQQLSGVFAPQHLFLKNRQSLRPITGGHRGK